MTITPNTILKAFPSEENCIKLLEEILWSGVPVCPYCKASNFSRLNGRYHCNTCNSSFSVTAKTIFRRTRCDLRKWFFAIYLLSMEQKLSLRDMAEKIETTKDTASLLSNKINKAKIESPDLINEIIKAIKSK